MKNTLFTICMLVLLLSSCRKNSEALIPTPFIGNTDSLWIGRYDYDSASYLAWNVTVKIVNDTTVTALCYNNFTGNLDYTIYNIKMVSPKFTSVKSVVSTIIQDVPTGINGTATLTTINNWQTANSLNITFTQGAETFNFTGAKQ